MAGILEGRLRKDSSEYSELCAIIPEKEYLTPDEITVYALDNGTCKSVIDTNTHLISDNVIDFASHDIEEEFYKLYDLLVRTIHEQDIS